MITFSSFFSPSSFLLHTRTIFPSSFFPLFFSFEPLLFSFFHSFLFFPYHFLQTLEHSWELSFFLFLFLFSFFLSPFSLSTSSASFFPSIPSKHTNLKVTHNHTIWFSSNEDREKGKLPREENRLHHLLICSAFTTACLPPHRCLISSPLPTTCGRNGSNRWVFFFFFNFIIGLLCKIVL